MVLFSDCVYVTAVCLSTDGLVDQLWRRAGRPAGGRRSARPAAGVRGGSGRPCAGRRVRPQRRPGSSGDCSGGSGRGGGGGGRRREPAAGGGGGAGRPGDGAGGLLQ